MATKKITDLPAVTVPLSTDPLAIVHGGATSQTTIAQAVSAVTLTEAQVTNLTSDLALKAPLASPALTGTPTAPTPANNDSSTKIATTAFVASNKLSSQATASATQNLNHNTLQAIAFATNNFDNGGIHSASVNNTRFTVPVGGAGIWMFIGAWYFTVPVNPTAGTYQLGTRKNGAGSTEVLMELPLSPATEATICGSVAYQLADGDFIEFIAYQFTSGGTVIVTQTGFTTGFACKIA